MSTDVFPSPQLTVYVSNTLPTGMVIDSPAVVVCHVVIKGDSTESFRVTASSVTVMVLSDVDSIRSPEVSVTAAPDMSSRGDVIAATERRWSSFISMEITAESATVFSVAPVRVIDCPESWMTSPDRSTMLTGVTSTALENSTLKIPVPSSKEADVSNGPETNATLIIGTPLPK